MKSSFKHDFKNQFYPAGHGRKRVWLQTRTLAVFVIVFCLVFIALIAYPLSFVFAGEGGWILNQGLSLFSIPPFELFGLGTISIGTVFLRFYALCMLIGVLLGYFFALFLAGRGNISTGIIDKLFFGMVLSGLVGARLGFVLFNFQFYQDNLFEILNFSRGGLSFFGGLTGGLVYLFLYIRLYKFNLFELLDIVAPAVLVGQIVGRWGNFFNYEAYGPSTGLIWKMYVPESARLANNYAYENLNVEFFHPTFLYEIILNLFLFLGILWFYDQLTNKRSGFVFGVYAIGYGLIRFFIEFLRLDALTIILPDWFRFSLFGWFVFDRIMVSQVFALVLVGVGVLVLVKRRKVLFLNKSMKEVRV